MPTFFPEVDAMPIAESLIKRVTVETAYGPSFDFEDPFAPGPPNPYLEKLKPKITLFTPAGQPVVIAPYGNPPPTKWPMLRDALVVGGVLGVVGIAWLALR